ncbi:deoxycytidine deaminase [Streptomyces sp. NBC_00439]|uniref:dCTP deaminase n=1 Tax=unclassified Streptomyces TaxID=2593676 RepID=UPI00224E4FEA|nr:deoxycytidine deaminase [Streptomyces sp. NBC_00439]MCX5103671.1 deoxycytidine deaminase [Streptomyces sp. NBC_00439]WSX06185.1 deoxycytidine deaminase [Streptomyces sp. NBC_00987]
MILTGPEIERQRRRGALTITPFAPELLNPVSVNYRLGDTLRVHRSVVLDTRATSGHSLSEFVIPPEGVELQPGRTYLGTTAEEIGSDEFVPWLIGRSSLGRLGMFLQFSAALGHQGSRHRWTLEIKVVQPLRVYAGMTVGQVMFVATQGAACSYTGFFGHISQALTPLPGRLSDTTMRERSTT